MAVFGGTLDLARLKCSGKWIKDWGVKGGGGLTLVGSGSQVQCTSTGIWYLEIVQ